MRPLNLPSRILLLALVLLLLVEAASFKWWLGYEGARTAFVLTQGAVIIVRWAPSNQQSPGSGWTGGESEKIYWRAQWPIWDVFSGERRLTLPLWPLLLLNTAALLW